MWRIILTVRMLFPLLLCTFACSQNGPTETDPDDTEIKGQAEAFALKVIQSIVELDPVAFGDSLGDTLWFLEEYEGPLLTAEFDLEEIFENFHHRDSEITMENFVSSYDYTVYDRDEILTLEWFPRLADPFADPPLFGVTDKDYLFRATIKEGESGILQDDLLTFMVSKRSGHWQVLAMTS